MKIPHNDNLPPGVTTKDIDERCDYDEAEDMEEPMDLEDRLDVLLEKADREEKPMRETFVLFWNGPFSQWAPTKFVVDGIEYNCAEQYMMAEKARFFGDYEARFAIMESTSPAEQKALGRRVRNFDKARWEAVARRIVYDGNRAKFMQNPSYRLALIETDRATIVEASPEDTIWGIGLGETDPRARDRAQWRGTNWLGEVLTRLRDSFIYGIAENPYA